MKIDSLKNVSVVAVDDDMVLLTIIKGILSSHGAAVYGSTTVREGLKLVKEKMPDLIVLDRYLQQEDGLSLIKTLKKDEQTSDIPILMLTGESREGEVDKALGEGATWYVIKPFQPQILVDRALCAINRQSKDSQGDVFYIDG